MDLKTFSEISESSPNIYHDLLQPSVQNIGNALGTVTGLLNTLLTPIEKCNEKTRIDKQRFLDEYQSNLKTIPEEKICPPNPALAGPIIEHLKWKISEEELRKKYAKLLSEVSNCDSLVKPLLSFDNVLNQLTPYEVELLSRLFSGFTGQSYALASVIQTADRGYIYLYKNIPDISFKDFTLTTLSVIIANYERLGLIYIDLHQFVEPVQEKYKYIFEHPTILALQKGFREAREQTHLSYPECKILKHAFFLTPFGESFVNTVLA